MPSVAQLHVVATYKDMLLHDTAPLAPTIMQPTRFKLSNRCLLLCSMPLYASTKLLHDTPPNHDMQAPGLAVVIVGERGDSQTYVRMKKRACEEVGIVSFGADLPETATQEEVLAVVQGFNADPRVHGILVQLPVSG